MIPANARDAKGLLKSAIRKSQPADGKMTAAERKDVHKNLNQANKDIYKDKHNAELRQRTP